jgi:hypothetical protein
MAAEKGKAKAKGKGKAGRTAAALDYPRHSVKKALRIPTGILDQNAGKPCTDAEAVKYAGMNLHGQSKMELSSSLKFGFLKRPSAGSVEVTELGKQVIRPQNETSATAGLRQAVLNAPLVSEVYQHFRGENLPDEPFFGNTLTDKFHVPAEKHDEFKGLFLDDLREANLIEERDGKTRVIDVSSGEGVQSDTGATLKKLSKSVDLKEGDSCFVMMPFAGPVGGYYKTIYEPAIVKAGLKAVRADDDIFSVGKIIDQICQAIVDARVLVAELSGRNANVFYELGLAHALKKPVVLVSSNMADVPFDVKHIRVILYDMNDPFWGDKLIAKVSENILSAIANPQEAILPFLDKKS